MLTAKGVKPVCSYHQVFQFAYLFGAFSPVTGESFLLEMPQCNGDTFQVFLNEMDRERPDEFKIIVLDNGAFHKAKKLIIPPSIRLLFLPPYSPELNPAEKMWTKFKRAFTNKIFRSLEQISEFIREVTETVTPEIVKSTCRYNYIFTDPVWTI
jgi:transposase